MDPTTIELKVLYGKDLRVSNYFQKPLVFVQVSISGDDPDSELDPNLQQTQKTPTVMEENGNPEWNHLMRFNLSGSILAGRQHFSLQFDLRHEGLVFGDKPIGDVRVPLVDLLEGTAGIVRFVGYEVRVDGKANGSLNFSYKVNLNGGDLGGGLNLSPAGGDLAGYSQLSDPVCAYPVPVQVYPDSSVEDVVAYPVGLEVGYPVGAPYLLQDPSCLPVLNGCYPSVPVNPPTLDPSVPM